jgi:hypothetical protein
LASQWRLPKWRTRAISPPAARSSAATPVPGAESGNPGKHWLFSHPERPGVWFIVGSRVPWLDDHWQRDRTGARHPLCDGDAERSGGAAALDPGGGARECGPLCRPAAVRAQSGWSPLRGKRASTRPAAGSASTERTTPALAQLGHFQARQLKRRGRRRPSRS